MSMFGSGVEEGHGHREAARHFRVSPRFVNELMKRRRETDSLVPRRQGHAPGAGKLAPHVAFVRALMAASGELTLDELRAALEARGVLVPGRFWQPIQLPLQMLDVLRALGRDDAELRHVSADRVADLRALANQKVPRAVNNRNR